MKWIASVALLLGVFGGTFPPAARGDIYWFQDEHGVLHISNVPVDARFQFKEREKYSKETRIPSSRSRRLNRYIASSIPVFRASPAPASRVLISSLQM